MEHSLWLVPLGVVLGALGTLIGAGGGFILMPVLMMLYPNVNTDTLTSMSLAVVVCNAFSGSCSYARMKRIDYKSGLLFSCATIPGAALGAWSTGYIPRHWFNGVFGVLMVIAAAYLVFRRTEVKESPDQRPEGHVVRRVVESSGVEHVFSYNPKIGLLLSLFVGYISSVLGIGGGIVHVPILVRVLHFPVHLATATSLFILAIMALTGVIVHLVRGSFSHAYLAQTVALAIGVLIGSPIGAKLSSRVHGRWIIRVLAVALVMVGIRILIMAMHR